MGLQNEMATFHKNEENPLIILNIDIASISLHIESIITEVCPNGGTWHIDEKESF